MLTSPDRGSRPHSTAAWPSSTTLPLMRSLLREKMQHYVEVVFALADEAAER
jgi:hypothetical protein